MFVTPTFSSHNLPTNRALENESNYLKKQLEEILVASA